MPAVRWVRRSGSGTACWATRARSAWTPRGWGPEFSAHETRSYLDSIGAKYTELDEAALVRETAALVAAGHVVGWHQGRMEFGPRALGARSILADPRDPAMKDTLNMKIKFREGFRPFAPSVTEEAASEFFDLEPPHTSPFMLLVADVHADKRVIPSVTHVDGSARLQTVNAAENPLYHSLIAEFGRQTGVPVIINTSFNVRGEPIVCTPADALPLLHAHAHGRSGGRALPHAPRRPTRVGGRRATGARNSRWTERRPFCVDASRRPGILGRLKTGGPRPASRAP